MREVLKVCAERIYIYIFQCGLLLCLYTSSNFQFIDPFRKLRILNAEIRFRNYIFL